jgi:NADH-quinone oxidoreductase subunit M
VATKAPVLTIFLVIIALANIALPLTNAFVGEFMMFAGLWQYSHWFAAVAAISIILAAIYTLNMIRNIFYGNVAPLVEKVKDINISQKLILSVVVVAIFMVGIFPQPLIELTKVSTGYLLSIMGK